MTTRCARQTVEREDRGVGQIRHLVDAGHGRHRGAPADIDEDARRAEAFAADRIVSAALEAGVALHDGAAGHAAQPLLDAGARPLRHRRGARLDAGHVDADRRIDHNAEIGAAPREMRGIGAGHQRLGRHAAGVDAGAAEQVALDHRHRHAGGGQPPGERRPGLSGADDDRVEAPAHRTATTIRIAATMATASSIKAAGASLPNAAASLARTAAPPSVPITAPTIPAIAPTDEPAKRRANGRTRQGSQDDAHPELHRHLAARGVRQLIGDELDERQHGHDRHHPHRTHEGERGITNRQPAEIGCPTDRRRGGKRAQPADHADDQCQ